MGVHGLWKLIEPSGKPVPVETLENKVLAVDVSIWLHQLMKGYQNPGGSSVSNAYLLGLFSRVCKLLFTNVKPVFVFDGGVPQLKKKTIASRQQQKNKSVQASEKLREQLLKNLLKQKAVSQVLEEIQGQSSPKKKAPDMFKLPPLPQQEDSASEVEEMSQSSSEEDVKPIKIKYKDLHTVDVNSAEFKALPADMRHDILTELKETRKQSSWGRIHEMPEELGDFSTYQMSRLLKRRSVQVSLEEAEKEMGGRTLSLHDVEALMAEGGIEINPQLGKRIASDDVTRFIYVREGDKQLQLSQNDNISLSERASKEENSPNPEDSTVSEIKIKEEIISSDEMSDTELIKEVEAIETVHRIKKENEDFGSNEENEEFGNEDIFENESSSEETFLNDVNIMKENSGLSQEQILAIIKDQNRDQIKHIDQSAPSTSKEAILIEEKSEELQELEDEIKDDSTTTKVSIASSTFECQSKASDMLYFKMMERMYGFKNKTKTKKNYKLSNDSVKNLVTEERTQVGFKPFLTSNASESDRDSDHSLPCTVSNAVLPNTISVSLFSKNSVNDLSNKDLKHPVNNGLDKVAGLSSSESDNDFVEVSSPKESISLSETRESIGGIHIEIQANKEPIEDDIFADIFSKEKYNESVIDKEKKEKAVGSEFEESRTQIEPHPSKAPVEDDVFAGIFSDELHCELANKNVEIKIPKKLEKKEDSNKLDKREDPLKEKKKESNCSETASLHQNSEMSDNSSITKLPILEEEKLSYPKLSNETELPAEPREDDIRQNVELNNTEEEVGLTTNVPEESEDSEEVDDPISKEDKNKSDPVEKPKRILNTKQLEKLQDILETKEQEILLDQNREDRMATSLTDQMYQEAQELLRLFGVPYVVAPMEAEAQCAFMDLSGLTQGTITDDSDIWLFGGRTVYKNFFDQKKFVLEFKADNINHYFKLNRNGLVLLALLVGSDYTEGLTGVGPVTALEILSTFPPPAGDTRDSTELLSSLLRFKQWWESSTRGHVQLAKKLRNVDLHQGFPSQAVVAAYLQPRVDESREPFSWGSPDLPALRDYAERKFGWSRNRTDQILQPVINKLSNKTSQLTLHTFFGAVPNITRHREQMSRRVQSAVNRLEGGSGDFEPLPPQPRQRNSGRGRGRGRGRNQDEQETSSALGVVSMGRGRARNAPHDDEEKFIHGKLPEVIPQREKDRLEALKRKQQAVEIFKKKRKGMKKRKNIRQIKPEAGLSESSSEEN